MALAHHNLVVWQRADDLFIGYIDAATFAEFDQKLRFIGAPLHGLIVRHKAKNALRQGATVLLAVIALFEMVV